MFQMLFQSHLSVLLGRNKWCFCLVTQYSPSCSRTKKAKDMIALNLEPALPPILLVDSFTIFLSFL